MELIIEFYSKDNGKALPLFEQYSYAVTAFGVTVFDGLHGFEEVPTIGWRIVEAIEEG